MGERLVRLIVASAIGGAVGLVLGGPPRVVAQGLPAVSIDDASVVEGHAGSNNVTITLRLSGPSSTPVSVSWATRGTPPDPGVGLFLNGFFPIGAFAQPTTLFNTWKARGINTMDGFSGEWGYTVDTWQIAAENAGLKTIRDPGTNQAGNIGNTNILAWMQGDEPDASGNGVRNLPAYQANYNAWKIIDPNRPVFVNLAGPDTMSAVSPDPPWCTPPDYNCSLVSNHINYVNTTMDWVANDLYPVTGYLPDSSRREDLTYLVAPIDRIRGWTDKPQFCHIESSDQGIRVSGFGSRGVTPAELRAEIWLAIAHGVRGIIYFADVFDASENWLDWDGTTAAVAAEMVVQNAVITSIAPVLQGEIDPSSIHASVPAPLQVCWRNAPSGKYFIVVNPVAATQSGVSMTLTGVSAATATVINETPNRTVNITGNAITDTFTAHAVHIYKVD